MLEYCLLVNIRHLSVVCEDYWIERLARLGWNPHRLGRAKEHRGSVIVGLRLDMTRQALGTTRAFYGIDDDVLPGA
jgi:acyl-homoserine lactone synthase